MSTKTERVPKSMSDNRILKFFSWIRGFHVCKNWWTPTCGESLPLQPELANAEDKNAVESLSKPNSQGSVEVCGKAVNRGGGLGMEIPCVCIFMFLGNTWIYFNNC